MPRKNKKSPAEEALDELEAMMPEETVLDPNSPIFACDLARQIAVTVGNGHTYLVARVKEYDSSAWAGKLTVETAIAVVVQHVKFVQDARKQFNAEKYGKELADNYDDDNHDEEIEIKSVSPLDYLVGPQFESTLHIAGIIVLPPWVNPEPADPIVNGDLGRKRLSEYMAIAADQGAEKALLDMLDDTVSMITKPKRKAAKKSAKKRTTKKVVAKKTKRPYTRRQQKAEMEGEDALMHTEPTADEMTAARERLTNVVPAPTPKPPTLKDLKRINSREDTKGE